MFILVLLFFQLFCLLLNFFKVLNFNLINVETLVLLLFWGVFIGYVFLWAVYAGANVNIISTQQRIALT